MRKKTKLLAMLLLLARLHLLSAQETVERASGQPKAQRSESEASSQTVTSEQLEQIYAVIDDMRDQWAADSAEYENLILAVQSENDGFRAENERLSSRKRFWIRVSVCEALLIAAGAYCMHAYSK